MSMEELKPAEKTTKQGKKPSVWIFTPVVAVSYFLVEVFAQNLLETTDMMCLAFGACWAVLLACIVLLLLPRIPGRVLYVVTYYAAVLWTLGQTGYYLTFHKVMWIGDALFAGEGADYLSDILRGFPLFWFVAGGLLLILGVIVALLIPGGKRRWSQRLTCGILAAAAVVALFLLPQGLFQRDNEIWGTHSEYAQSSSYRATYETMYDAKKVYDMCGIYHLTAKDLWQHYLYPRTPWYQHEQEENVEQIDEYFSQRPVHEDNEMTGVLAGKNVILVLMESMDDWLITEEETPTLCHLMEEGISFTNFYSPGYGGARTINTEFCANTGIYLPTNGGYVFDYVTNSFNQSIASQLVANGYTAECFHYNDPSFYSRGVFEPALGYNAYNSFEDYVTDDDQLFDDCFLFDSEGLSDIFFREGQTFNFIITRSAHLSYVYNEVLSHYALKRYPEYRGKFGDEEIDCARVKAKLVDDMFARLMEELEARGELENTVIIGITDHYTYGFKDVELLLELSGVEDELMLEKTPCFIWSAAGPSLEVDKTLNTADLLPTVLNLLGIDSPYAYLGQDAFDPNYEGYALFTNGSWVTDGVICKASSGGNYEILANENGVELTQEYMQKMSQKVLDFVRVSNLLLISDYYSQPRTTE